MLLRRLALLSLCIAGSPSCLVAQRVSVGDRVRVELPESEAQDENPWRRGLVIRGRVTNVSRDTIFLRPASEVGELAIPLAGVHELRRSLGMRSRPMSALREAVGAGVILSLVMGGTFEPQRQTYGVNTRAQAFAVGAMWGAIGGAVIGALQPTERWQRITLRR